MEDDFDKIYLENEIKKLVQESDNEMFKMRVESITQKYFHKRRQNRRIVILSAGITSLAAAFLLLLLLVNPFQQIKISGYLAKASESIRFPVEDIGINLRGGSVQPTLTGFREVKFVNDYQLQNKYFVRNNILFLSIADKPGKLFRRINNEGRMEFFYKKSSDGTFALDLTKENRIMEFQKVKDPDLLKLINNNN